MANQIKVTGPTQFAQKCLKDIEVGECFSTEHEEVYIKSNVLDNIDENEIGCYCLLLNETTIENPGYIHTLKQTMLVYPLTCTIQIERISKEN